MEKYNIGKNGPRGKLGREDMTWFVVSERSYDD